MICNLNVKLTIVLFNNMAIKTYQDCVKGVRTYCGSMVLSNSIWGPATDGGRIYTNYHTEMVKGISDLRPLEPENVE